MNALRHGLTAQVTIMSDEDRLAYNAFCAAIVESLAPEGPLETQLAQSVAEERWQKLVTARFDNYAAGADPGNDITAQSRRCGHRPVIRWNRRWPSNATMKRGSYIRSRKIARTRISPQKASSISSGYCRHCSRLHPTSRTLSSIAIHSSPLSRGAFRRGCSQ